MNFDDENSKIYHLIDVCSIVIIILVIAHFTQNSGNLGKTNYLNIMIALLAFSKVLMGTKRVVAQKDKKGYRDFVLAGIAALWFFSNYFTL